MLVQLHGVTEVGVGVDIGRCAIELVVRTFGKLVRLVDEVRVVGRLELVGRVGLADESQATGEAQVRLNLPFQVEVVRDVRVRGVVDGVERRVVDGVGIVACLP